MSDINNREFKRFDFRPGMWVKINKANQKMSDFKMYQLVDLSQGGISFKSHSKSEFSFGQKLYVLEVENLILKDALKAIVRYVSPLDEFGVDFKVGVEFIGKV